MKKERSALFLNYNAACSDNSLWAFQDNLSAPSSRVKNPRRASWPLKMGADTLYGNVSKELPLHPTFCRGRAQVT